MVGSVAAYTTLFHRQRSQVCDSESHKIRDLERLIVGPQGGVANTIVFLKDISRGKGMDIPEARRSLDQKHAATSPTSCWCRRTARSS